LSGATTTAAARASATGSSTRIFPISSNAELCNSEECYDEVLLGGLADLIDKSQRDLLIVLHQKGSHGPAYYKRVPERFRRFTPVCSDSELKHCSKDEIVNAYDNTILYTDYFLSRVLGILKERASRDTALLYLSDHGESLGENNLYLHGTPYLFAPEEQTHVPFLLWLSETYAQDFAIDSQCLRQKAGGDYSHDNLFHSLLGMLEITTADYDASLDIFAGCRGSSR
jgi:lipid A ethanolaminephosphotransferase